MADLEPITREESFLNGTDLEPITRKEYFYAGKESELPEGHREPKTREEWFIKKYREAGDVTVESLSVTENGTYTAPEGKAYSPVSVDVQPTLVSKNITANGDYSASSDNADGYSSISVNVPLPSNAYLLKEIENTDIATFTDGSDLPMPKLEVAIEPVQSGSGDPSPTNIRPISGWDEVNVTVADATTDPTVSNVYTIDLDGTRYGGTLDLVSGVLTLTHEEKDMGEFTWSTGTDATGQYFQTNANSVKPVPSSSEIADILCEIYKPSASDDVNESNIAVGTTGRVYVRDSRYSTAQEFTTAMSGIKLITPLATPTTIQLTPTQVKSLVGQNNAWANSGKILNGEYFSQTE